MFYHLENEHQEVLTPTTVRVLEGGAATEGRDSSEDS